MTEVGVGAALGYPPEAAGAPAIRGERWKSDFVFSMLVTRIPWLLSNPWMRVVVLARSCFRVFQRLSGN